MVYVSRRLHDEVTATVALVFAIVSHTQAFVKQNFVIMVSF